MNELGKSTLEKFKKYLKLKNNQIEHELEIKYKMKIHYGDNIRIM
jgi:hypothetical protein